MTDDLKQRLRAVCETGCDPDLPFEAADRIEQLEAERNLHHNRLASLLFSDFFKPEVTAGMIQDIAAEYTNAIAERDELKALIENHQLCEKEPVGITTIETTLPIIDFDRGATYPPCTKIGLIQMQTVSSGERLYRAAIAKGEK